MPRVVILGAGFAGVSAALELRKLLPPGPQVTLIEPRTVFRMGLANLGVIDGRRSVEEGRRNIDTLASRGIEVKRAKATRIETASHHVLLEGGERVAYDRLLVALGADTTPFLGGEHGHDVYQELGAASFRDALAKIQKGRVLVTVCGTPFKCPPAPYEAALIVDAVLRKRGVRDAVEVHLTTPEPYPVPVAPPETGNQLLAILKERGIQFWSGLKPARFHKTEVEFDNGSRKPFDLLAFIPPHRAPEVVAASGLADETGFIPVDAATMRTHHPDLWAAGDVTRIALKNGKNLPKAGTLAEGQGLSAAHDIVRSMRAKATVLPFKGEAECFIEVGEGRAMRGLGHFYEEPEPKIDITAASEGWLRAKNSFESDRLARWFGPT